MYREQATLLRDIHGHVSGILAGEQKVVESMTTVIDELEAADVENMM
jgi:hypothetical protein